MASTAVLTKDVPDIEVSNTNHFDAYPQHILIEQLHFPYLP